MTASTQKFRFSNVNNDGSSPLLFLAGFDASSGTAGPAASRLLLQLGAGGRSSPGPSFEDDSSGQKPPEDDHRVRPEVLWFGPQLAGSIDVVHFSTLGFFTEAVLPPQHDLHKMSLWRPRGQDLSNMSLWRPRGQDLGGVLG